eukprot:g36826.t1
MPVRRKDKDGKVRDPWIMREFVNLVKREKEACLSFRKLKSDRAREEYKVSRKELKQGVMREKDMEDSEICVEHANKLWHFEIKKEVVLGLLKSIKVDKSPGSNGIYPRLLSKARGEIVGALTKIFVSSLATGEVPEDWQEANVVPLFKKGSRENPENYRPKAEDSGGRVFFRLDVRDWWCSTGIYTGTFVIYKDDLDENVDGSAFSHLRTYDHNGFGL